MDSKLTNKEYFEILKKAILESNAKDFCLQLDEGFYDVTFKELKVMNNGLDKENQAYDEYEALFFEEQDDDEVFQIDYHNLPLVVYLDDDRIFDTYEVEDDRPIKIDFNFFYPFNDCDKSNYDYIDNNVELLNKYLKVKKLLKAPYIPLSSGQNRFDNKIYLKTEKELLEAYDDFLSSLTLVTENKYRIIDLFEPSYKVDKSNHVFSKFTKKDFNFISESKTIPILNKGAEYYTKGDYSNSFPYYLVAALDGNIDAISNLGYSYMYGRGVEKNMDLALSCFVLASKRNSADASYKLGTLYKYNEKLRDLKLSKQYFIKAMNQIRYMLDKSYSDFPSLCLAIAKEKIDGKTFVKDIYGAFLLLIFAYKGYKIDLQNGFEPHRKQYDETLELINNEMFINAKKYYRKNLECSYSFGDYELTFDNYCSKNTLIIGDKALVLVKSTKYIDDDEIEVNPGDEIIVEKMYDYYCLARLINGKTDKLVDFVFDELRKI